jgi:hypothetical protein
MANLLTEAFTDLVTNPWSSSGSTAIVPGGKTGNGVLVPASSTLNIPMGALIDPNSGTVEFWVSPQWDGTDLGVGKNEKHFIHLYFSSTYYMKLYLYSTLTYGDPPFTQKAYLMGFKTNVTGVESTPLYCTCPVAAWKSGEWHRIRIYYDFTLGAGLNYYLFQVDDYYSARSPVLGALSKSISSGVIYLGQSLSNTATQNAECIFDSLLIDGTSLLGEVPYPVAAGPEQSVTGAINSPDTPGLARLTVTGHGYTTGQWVWIKQVGGVAGLASTTGASYPVTVIDLDTFDVLGTTWGSSSYTSGGKTFWHFDQWGTVDFRANVEDLYVDDGICSFMEHRGVSLDCAARAVGDDVVFFEKKAYERVYPGTVPTAGEIKTTISYQGAKGEIVPLFFNIHTKIALTNAFVTKTAFGGTVIPTTELDLRVVRNWYQKSAGDTTGLPTFIPELLMHDDRIALETVEPPNALFQSNAAAVGATYLLPTCPIATRVDTDFLANTAKQFVLITKIPADAVPGTYTCTITVKADEIANQILTLSLEILPFALQSPADVHWMLNYSNHPDYWYGLGFLDAAGWATYVDWFLQDMLDHGLNRLHLYGGYLVFDGTGVSGVTKLWNDYTYTETVLSRAAALGFTECCCLITVADPLTANKQATITAMHTLMQTYFPGKKSKFYGMNEASYSSAADRNGQIALHAFIDTLVSGAGAEVSCQTPYADMVLFDALTPSPVDIPIYHLQTLASQDFLADSYDPANRTDTREVGYWWQAEVEHPSLNRRLCGFWAWLTGAKMINMHGHGSSAANCYNEYRVGFSYEVMLYPSKHSDGTTLNMLPTIQYEAVRSGINDYKYLETWSYYYNRVKVAHPTEAETSRLVIVALLEKHKFLSDSLHNPIVDPVTIDQYDTDRTAIIDEITYLRGYDTATSGRRSVISGIITAMWKRFRKIGGVTQ